MFFLGGWLFVFVFVFVFFRENFLRSLLYQSHAPKKISLDEKLMPYSAQAARPVALKVATYPLLTFKSFMHEPILNGTKISLL